MSNLLVNTIIVIVKAISLPGLVFLGGVLIMVKISGHGYVTQQLRQKATPDNRRELNMRFRGYDTAAVDRHWGALDNHALKIEQHFLKLDLLFPFFYGAAFIVALLHEWALLGKTFSPVWLIGLAALTMIADWTENLVHLNQLRLYMESGKAGLEPRWIQVASIATIVKLFFFSGMLLLLIYLSIYRVVRPINPPL